MWIPLMLMAFGTQMRITIELVLKKIRLDRFRKAATAGGQF